MAAELRRAALKTALRTAPPDMLVVDKHPGGFQGELLPALAWLRRHSPQTVVVLGLRDILDEPQQLEADWRAENNNSILRRFYSRAWIYGDARLCPATEDYGFAPELARMARSCGFVTSPPTSAPLSPGGSPALVATVGGGSDGRPVLEAAARAAAALRADYPKLSLRLFAGPLMSADDYRALRREAELLGRFIRLERFSNRMPRYIAGADAVIAMGGYNTVLECVALRRPAVIVPREHPRREQLIRAESFERAGLVQTVRMGELQTSQLELKLRAILSRNWIARDSGSINLDGRDHVLHDIKALLENRRLAEMACA